MGSFPLPVIAVSGTPAECGAAYGAAAADLIAANNEAYLRRFGVRAGLSPAMVRAVGARFRATTLEYHPRIAAMLDGVANGSGVSVGEIYAMNARTELLYGATPADLGECTSAALVGPGTGTLLGLNWDWYPDQRSYSALLATTDEHGFSVVTLVEAGMLAKAGLNSAGLGVCLNMLGCDRDGTPGGVPYHVLVRAALEATDLAVALRALCQSPRSASINLMVGQAYPAQPAGSVPRAGEVIDVELVPGEVGFLHPDPAGRLVHANHLESRVAREVRDVCNDLGGSSVFRAARARRLLADGLSLDEVFTDHLGFPNAICRHADPRDAPDEQSESVLSVLLDLDARRFGIAPGPPCTSSYEWVALADVVASPHLVEIST
jgi:isopenicillin-N N-acyltransferase-like protein